MVATGSRYNSFAAKIHGALRNLETLHVRAGIREAVRQSGVFDQWLARTRKSKQGNSDFACGLDIFIHEVPIDNFRPRNILLLIVALIVLVCITGFWRSQLRQTGNAAVNGSAAPGRAAPGRAAPEDIEKAKAEAFDLQDDGKWCEAEGKWQEVLIEYSRLTGWD